MVVDGVTRMLGRLLRFSRGGFSVLMLAPSIVLANVDVCQQPDASSRLSLGYYKQGGSDLSANAGEVRRKDHDLDLQYRVNDRWLIGVGHRYVILDVEPVELQTNGHLHTLFFPVHRQRNSDRNSFRFSIAPALSTSSNVLKDPGEYTADTFQLLATLMWARELSAQATLRFGLCGDHRFGRYLVYPSFSIGWRPGADLTVELGLPVSRLSYRVSNGVDLSIKLAPDGNEWHVMSKDGSKRSRLVARAVELKLALNWRASQHLGVTVGIARLLRNRYEAVLLDDTRVKLSHNATTRAGLALEWRF